MVAGCYLVDVSVCYLAALPTSSQTLMGNFKTFNHTDRWDDDGVPVANLFNNLVFV